MSLIIKKKVTDKLFDDLVYVNSIYSLMIYMSIKRSESKTLYLLGKSLDKEFIFDCLDNVVIINENYTLPRLHRLLIGYDLWVPSNVEWIKRLISSSKNFFIHDHLPLSVLFVNKNVNILEDGLANYQVRKGNSGKLSNCIKKVLGLSHEPYGWNKNVTSVFLTGFKSVPSDLKHKYVHVDRENLSMSIKNCFGGILNIEFINKYKEFDLLITQPLSEDGILTEEIKIQLYSKIIALSDKMVVIKPHPRELTDYSKLFSHSSVVVLEGDKLLESLYGNDNLCTVYSLFSTAAYYFELNRKYTVKLFGTANIEELIQRFGVIEPNEDIL